MLKISFLWDVSEIAYKTEKVLWKFFGLMISLDSDKMTALWPNGSFSLFMRHSQIACQNEQLCLESDQMTALCHMTF